MSDGQPKDFTTGDLLDEQRRNVAKQKAQNSAGKKFTLEYVFPVKDTVDFTDTSDTDFGEPMADTVDFQDIDLSDLQTARNFKWANEFGWVDRSDHVFGLGMFDGKNCKDYTTKHKTPVIVGSPTFVDNPVSPLNRYGVRLGSGKYIEIADDADLRVASGGAVTLLAWMKTSSQAAFDILFSKRTGAGSFNYQFYFSGNDLVLTGSSGNAVTYSNSGLRNDKLHFLAATYNNGTGKIYADSILRATNTGLIFTSGTQPLYIGKDDVGFSFNGDVYSADVVTGELTEAQIRTFMMRGQLEQPIMWDFFNWG